MTTKGKIPDWKCAIFGLRYYEQKQKQIYIDPILGWSIWVFSIDHDIYSSWYVNEYFAVCDSEDFIACTKMIRLSMRGPAFIHSEFGTYKYTWYMNFQEKEWLQKKATEYWDDIIDGVIEVSNRDFDDDFLKHKIPVPDYSKIRNMGYYYTNKGEFVLYDGAIDSRSDHLHEFTIDSTTVQRQDDWTLDLAYNELSIGQEYFILYQDLPNGETPKATRISVYEPAYIHCDDSYYQEWFLNDKEIQRFINLLKMESDYWYRHSVWDFVFKEHAYWEHWKSKYKYHKKFVNHKMPDYTGLSKQKKIYIPREVYRQIYQVKI